MKEKFLVLERRFQYSHFVRTYYSNIFKLCCAFYNIDKFENNNDDLNHFFFEYSNDDLNTESSEDSIDEEEGRNPLVEAILRQRIILLVCINLDSIEMYLIL